MRQFQNRLESDAWGQEPTPATPTQILINNPRYQELYIFGIVSDFSQICRKNYFRTNKLKCQKLGGTLNAYNFGQNGQSWNFFRPIIKPSKSWLWGQKKIWISTFFACVTGQNVSLPPNLHSNLALLHHFLVRLTLNPHNFGQSGRNVDFFLPIIKPMRWRF